MKRLIMVGLKKVKGEVKGFRMVDHATLKPKDYTLPALLKAVKDKKVEVRNLNVLEDDDEVKVTEGSLDSYGTVGESNAFVVIEEVRNNQLLLHYLISDVNGCLFQVRIPDLASLCKMYPLANGMVCKSAIKTLGGYEFDVKQTGDTREVRIEKAIRFVEELQTTSITVTTGIFESRGRSTMEFAMNACGRVGKIRVMPGTEAFNKRITQLLNFSNVKVCGTCKYIQPSYGYLANYTGWMVNGLTEVMSLPKCDFSIEDVGWYSSDSIMRKYKANKLDYEYSVYIADLGAEVYVKKDNSIGFVHLRTL